MADLLGTIGLDDAEFQAALARVEGQVSERFGRIGAVINARTAGVRQFTGAISGTVGIVGRIVGAVGRVNAIIGTVVGGVLAISSAFEDVDLDAQRLADTLNRIYGRTEDILSSVRSIRFDTASLDVLNAALFDMQELVIALDRQLGPGLPSPATAGLFQQREEALRRMAELERAVEFARKAQVGRAETDLVLLRERNRAQEEERAKAQRERDEREAERRRELAFSEELNALQLEADLARAEGREEDAEAIQTQIELRRRIRQIEESETLSDVEKARRIALARRIAGTATPSPDVAPSFSTLAAGLSVGGQTLIRQALGAGDNNEIRQRELAEKRTKDTEDIKKQLIEALRLLREKPSGILLAD